MNQPIRTVAIAAVLIFVAGTARAEPPSFERARQGFFMRAPKRLARIERLDRTGRQLTLHLETSGATVTRGVRPDLDVFLHGAFGLLSDLQPGQRVWVVFDRGGGKGDMGPIRFIADELGVEAIHDDWYAVGSVDASAHTIVLTHQGDKPETRPLAGAVRVVKGEEVGSLELLHPGDRVRFSTHYEDGQNRVAEILDAAAVQRAAVAQQERTTRALQQEGVPGEFAPDSSNASAAAILLYRPGGDWARALSAGAPIRVSLGGSQVDAVVRRVSPWGDKTRVDFTLAAGQPVAGRRQSARAFLAPPPDSPLPPGLGRGGTRSERIEWFLSSVYCSCGNGSDVCTGQLYTLSLCSADGSMPCAMPAAMRKEIGVWIDQGKSDAEILNLLQTKEGLVVRHLHLKR